MTAMPQTLETNAISSSSSPRKQALPNFFAAHQYEYEISPEQHHRTTETTNDSKYQNHIITETSLPMTKTVYLIRHAESDENRRKACLKTSMQGLGKLKLPKKEDVVASMELMNVQAQLNSNVSPRGQEQIDQLGKRITEHEFVRKMGIELVAHSPLQRARQTSYGMLQCVAPASSQSPTASQSQQDDAIKDNDPIIMGCKHPSVKRVVELEILSERTPIEWLPIQHDAYTKRIAEFEMWLSQQPEDVIAIVGHSLYFKNMLGLESKFRNVDVWSLQFDFTVENSVQRVKRDVHDANEIQKKKKMQKHFENLSSMIQKTNLNRRMKNANSPSNKEENSREDTDDDEEARTDTSSECVLDNRDEMDTVLSLHGPQTEMDGLPLDDLELPRGWRELRHHYRYDPTSPLEE